MVACRCICWSFTLHEAVGLIDSIFACTRPPCNMRKERHSSLDGAFSGLQKHSSSPHSTDPLSRIRTPSVACMLTPILPRWVSLLSSSCGLAWNISIPRLAIKGAPNG